MQTDRELMEKVRQWNATDRPYPQNRCIHQLFEDQAAKTPDAIAVVFEDQTLTYSQLNAKANQLAHYLRQQGVRADTPVGICMDRSLEMIVALMAILKAGGGVCAIGSDVSARTNASIWLKKVGISLILVAGAGIQSNFRSPISRGLIRPTRRTFKSCPADNPTWEGFPRIRWPISFTPPGPRENPKGVAWSTAPGWYELLLWSRRLSCEFRAGLRCCRLTPYAFDASDAGNLGPLLHGARLRDYIRAGCTEIRNTWSEYAAIAIESTPLLLLLSLFNFLSIPKSNIPKMSNGPIWRGSFVRSAFSKAF